jgi:hypothetical protein
MTCSTASAASNARCARSPAARDPRRAALDEIRDGVDSFRISGARSGDKREYVYLGAVTAAALLIWLRS